MKEETFHKLTDICNCCSLDLNLVEEFFEEKINQYFSRNLRLNKVQTNYESRTLQAMENFAKRNLNYCENWRE